MKKIIALVLILACVCSSSYAVKPDFIFSTFGSTEGTGDMFDGEYFSMILYTSPIDLVAYLQTTVWKGTKATTSLDFLKIKSKVGSNLLYFVYPDDSYITGHYDEEKDYKFWLNFEDASIQLIIEPNNFSPILDFKGE